MTDKAHQQNFIFIFSVIFLSLFSYFNTIILDFVSGPSLRAVQLELTSPVEKGDFYLDLQQSPDNLHQATATISSLVKEVSAVDLVFNYDPRKLQIKDIAPGSFLKNPVVLKKEINNQKGEAMLSLGTFSPQKGQGDLVVFELTPQSGVNQVDLSYSPNTQVSFIDLDYLKQPPKYNITLNF